MNIFKQKAKNIELKQKAENLGLKISVCSNIMFVCLELYISYFSNSKAVLLDGLFDCSQAVLLVVSIKLMKLLYKPVTEKRPFGYSNLEPFYMIMKGLIFGVITVMLVITSIVSLISGGYEVNFGIVFYFEIFAGLYGMVILLFMKHLSKNANSPILALEIKEWSFDTIGSLGLGAAFLLAITLKSTQFSFLSRYFDQMMMLVLAVYILPTPIKAIGSGVRELFFLSPTEEVLCEVKKSAYEVADLYGLKKENLDFDVVKTGRRLWISIYITIDSEFIEVAQLRKFQAELMKRYAVLSDIIDVDIIPDF
jgi:predicted Co/Zn/Cd cation transporter (cation efflux family)